MKTETRESGWLDGAEVCRILDLGHVRQVDRLVAEGMIGVRRLPGVIKRYSREDVVKIAKNCLIPARETASGAAAV